MAKWVSEHEDCIAKKVKSQKNPHGIKMIIKGAADTVYLCRLAAVLEDDRQKEVNEQATQFSLFSAH